MFLFRRLKAFGEVSGKTEDLVRNKLQDSLSELTSFSDVTLMCLQNDLLLLLLIQAAVTFLPKCIEQNLMNVIDITVSALITDRYHPMTEGQSTVEC